MTEEKKSTKKKRKPKASLSLPPATRELIERLAELEGLTPTHMMVKMASFYAQAISFLHKEGMTPDAFNAFLLDYRRTVMEKGMEALGATLRGEDYSAQGPPVQHLGRRKFQMPSESTIVAGEGPVEAAPPSAAQWEVK